MNTLQALIEQQNVQPANDFDALLGGWPANESVDDFVLVLDTRSVGHI